MKKMLSLFLSFLKIGAFTFGGGYAMIALIENEFVSKKKWISQEEFLDMTAIAESTPGPIAVNSATYIGYVTGGVPGALISTFGVCLPSFVLIYLISLFFDKFLALTLVSKAFKGIQACVIYLILSAGFKLFKGMKKDPVTIVIFSAVVAGMLAVSLFSLNFSTIYFILISGTVGIAVYVCSLIKAHGKEKK
ncbi:MAG: chromate transporter [Clostridia bacterium]|nr:chromate transporter [Clostridia bacterium]